MFPKSWKKYLKKSFLTKDEAARVDQAMRTLNSAGFDPWGMDPETAKAALGALRWVYRDYFRVETTGIERIPQGRVLLVANHGGQIPIDGLLVSMATVLEGGPPRIARGMVDRFVPMIPWVSTLFSRCGQMVGDHRLCRELLARDECVLVFPEGTKGSGKTIFERYQLQKFGTGFLRLALETQAPIVPVAVIGSEETYPGLMGLRPIAKRLGLPYLPITPFFPLLGVLGILPLPAKITLRFGEPMRFELPEDAPETLVEAKVEEVRTALQREIQIGLEKRGGAIFTQAAK